jgi:hypothetical protein
MSTTRGGGSSDGRPGQGPSRRLGEVSDSSFSAVKEFLERGDLLERMADAEVDIEHANCDDYHRVADRHGLTDELLQAATLVRREMGGGLDDLVHAAALTRAIPQILDDGEMIDGRPRLTGARDSHHPYDLETAYRVVIANISDWSEADAVRHRRMQREVFWDFMRLALGAGDRSATLVVLSAEPERFLRTDTHRMAWALDEAPRDLPKLFQRRRLGNAKDITVSSFFWMATHVEVIDLQALPGAVRPRA